MGIEPKETTGLFLAYLSQRYDIQEKIRIKPRILTTPTIKIYAEFQFNRKLNDSEEYEAKLQKWIDLDYNYFTNTVEGKGSPDDILSLQESLDIL
ncbi:hypothetical protein [Pectobacterium versatile]|uniref:hypothetical protein n=1 Tax=Pectobacterium versatile TaxID=2488639 RepID=UPI001CF2E042|nr:hypothetical protein [Pectobacterium versatile]MCA6926052.1 hypothetical protein [Pectobacterium versatile]MCH5082805.1 hypothetical protein [Pectobacterium versatile]